MNPTRTVVNAASRRSDSSLAGVVVGTIVEGCVGETLAALEAEASRELAPLAALRSAWSVIAHDEAKHAELAWSFIGWALGQADADLAQTARRSFEAAFASELVTAVLSATNEESLAAQGLLSEHARHELRRRAVEETLRPAAASLLQRAS